MISMKKLKKNLKDFLKATGMRMCLSAYDLGLEDAKNIKSLNLKTLSNQELLKLHRKTLKRNTKIKLIFMLGERISHCFNKCARV